VRWADDFIIGFEHEQDARRFLDELRDRFAKFGLELHPTKTRLIEFGRRVVRNRARGGGKPETFNFLGFTHICAKAKNGRFWLRRITISKRMRAKLAEVKDQLKRRRHQPIPEQGRWLAAVVRGHVACPTGRRPPVWSPVPCRGPWSPCGCARGARPHRWWRTGRRGRRQ
jgi:RNA-directed DNA polymerase